MTNLVIPPYVPPYTPVPNVTPFTYRDGLTYLQRMERIVRYMNKTLAPWMVEEVTELGDAFDTAVNTLIEQINAAIDAIINDSIEVQDVVVAGIVNQVDSLTRVALNAIYGDAGQAALIDDDDSLVRVALNSLYGDTAQAAIINNVSSATRIALNALYGDSAIADIVADEDSDLRAALELVLGDGAVADYIADADSDTKAALDAVYAPITGVPKLSVNRLKKAVFFGDSWLTINSAGLVTTLAGLMNLDAMNYGQSNAAFDNGPVLIQDQLTVATADTTVDKNYVEYVFVVCGSNNIYWNRDFTATSVRTFFANLEAMYPRAEIFYIPDNANDYNGGLTYKYTTLMNAAAYAGAKVADWPIWLMYYGEGSFYLGTDTNGKQHLSTAGYRQFAGWIANWIKGTSPSYMAINVDFNPTIDDANTSLEFTSGHSMADSLNNRSYINNGVVVMDINITNLEFKSGQTVPTLRLLGGLEPFSPISVSGGGSNVVGTGYAGSDRMVAVNLVPDATYGWKLFTTWSSGSGFTSVRLRVEYPMLGAQG